MSTVPASQFYRDKETGQTKAEHTTATVTHRAIHIGYACPDCGGSLMSSPGKTSYYCMGGHEFRDHDQLMARNPKKIPVPQLVAKQHGYVEIKVAIPGDLRDAMQKRFGDKFGPTIMGLMNALVQSRMFIVNDEDIKRITQHTGVEVANSSALVGKIYQLVNEIKELKEECEQAKQKGGGLTSGNGVVATFDGPTMIKLYERAKANDLTPSQLIEQKTGEALQNGWW